MTETFKSNTENVVNTVKKQMQLDIVSIKIHDVTINQKSGIQINLTGVLPRQEGSIQIFNQQQSFTKDSCFGTADIIMEIFSCLSDMFAQIHEDMNFFLEKQTKERDFKK